MSVKIVVADDHEVVRTGLATLLAGSDIKIVAEASSGPEAVKMAVKHKPDVVLLDIGMPKLNGYDACRKIRNQPQGANMLICALTGWGQEEDKRRSRDAGFDHHLTKPPEPDVLERLIMSCAG